MVLADRVAFPNLSGIPRDYMPVTADDDDDNVGTACIGLYVGTTAGNIRVITLAGQTRDIPVSLQAPLPVLCTRVLATGTTAAGIFALQG